MKTHWDNELEVIRLGRRAAHLWLDDNIVTNEINNIKNALGIIDQVLTLMYEELQDREDHDPEGFEVQGNYGGTI